MASLSAKTMQDEEALLGGHINGATTTYTFLILLKGFIGTGILFLPSAWSQGGILVSSIFFLFIAVWCTYNIILLVWCKRACSHPDHATYSSIAGEAWGPWARITVDVFVTTIQFAVVAVYFIFVASNMQACFGSFTGCSVFLDVRTWILITLPFYCPLALFRHVKYFAIPSLIADLFILTGLIYVFVYDFKQIHQEGVQNVELFVGKTFANYIGTTVFAFEGIQLCLPVEEGMKKRKDFIGVVLAVAVVCVVVYISSGVLGYWAFGADVKTVVLLSIPASFATSFIQFLYALAIFLSVPLQYFPAIKIVEQKLGSADEKASIVYFAIVRLGPLALLGAVAIIGAANFGSFVSILSAVVALPLAFIFPPFLHMKLCCTHKSTGWWVNVIIILAGVGITIFSIIQSITSLSPSSPATCHTYK